MVDLTKVHTQESAIKTLLSACPKFIDENYPNLNKWAVGLSGVISHALNAINTTFILQHKRGEFEFYFDQNGELSVKSNSPKPDRENEQIIESRYKAEVEIESRRNARVMQRSNLPKIFTRKLIRRSNSFGSGFAELAVIINKPLEKHLDVFKTEFEFLAEDETTVTVLYVTKNYYKGDDETIVHAIYGDFPSEITESGQFKIDWDKSGF